MNLFAHEEIPPARNLGLFTAVILPEHRCIK